MNPVQKRDAILARAQTILGVHETARTIPELHTSRVLKPQVGNISGRALADEMGDPICYLYVSAARDPRSLLGGPDAIIFQSHALTLLFYLEWRDADDFTMSSQSDYEKAIYSDDAAAPGLMYSLENDRLLQHDGRRAIIDRVSLSEMSEKIIPLRTTAQGTFVHCFQCVVTVSADVVQP